MEISLSPGRLMGAFNAGVADEAWGDLPMPMLSNPRVRFWFTERGWRAYGLRVAAEARASGRAFRVIRRKNPSRSMVIYRDDWQVAHNHSDALTAWVDRWPEEEAAAALVS